MLPLILYYIGDKSKINRTKIVFYYNIIVNKMYLYNKL